MDPDSVVEYDFPAFIRQYKSGRVERYRVADTVPAGTDDTAGTGVSSRDAVINPSTGLWARLFLPAAGCRYGVVGSRLPVVVFHHGGAFVAGSTAQRATHAYLTALAADANVLVVSPEYRLAPEHPLPAAFDDSWEALRWVASHAHAGVEEGTMSRRDPWLAEHGDLARVFVGGASAGATIAHNIAARAGASSLPGLPVLKGLVLVHPFFAGEEPIGAEPVERAKAGAFWRYRCPGTTRGLDDPLCNPFADGSAAQIAAERVLVCVAEKDALRDRGVWYGDGLRAGGYTGEVALHESLGVGHVFHYADPDGEQARTLHARVLDFLRQ